jgi:integration host factor subunit alpha
MSAITKIEVMEYLFNSVGLNKSEAKEILEALFEEVVLNLEQGVEVKISGLGNFTLHDKKARPGRNPRTGDMVTILPRRVVSFHAGQKLREKMERYAQQ